MLMLATPRLYTASKQLQPVLSSLSPPTCQVMRHLMLTTMHHAIPGSQQQEPLLPEAMEDSRMAVKLQQQVATAHKLLGSWLC